MTEKGPALMRSATLAIALALSGCGAVEREHGYAPSGDVLDRIVVDVDTRDSVAEQVGRPSTSALIGEDAWYYVESLWRSRGPLPPEEVTREVVAISFGDDGTVRNIERFGLEEGRAIALNRRVTDDNIADVSFLSQLLGSIGNISAEELTGEN